MFPLARQPLLRQTWSSVSVLALGLLATVPHALQSGGVPLVVAIVVTTACLAGVGYSSWQLLTRRPVLTIDSTGVRLGRRRFMAWSDIAAIAELDGSSADPAFAVVPKTRRRKLWIGRDYVRNVAMFRYWLSDLLEEHRRTST